MSVFSLLYRRRRLKPSESIRRGPRDERARTISIYTVAILTSPCAGSSCAAAEFFRGVVLLLSAPPPPPGVKDMTSSRFIGRLGYNSIICSPGFNSCFVSMIKYA